MGRGEHKKPSSSKAFSDRQNQARIRYAKEEHNKRLAAVSYRLESFPNLKNYLINNPAIGGEIWQNGNMVQQMHDDPQLMPAMDANPEATIQNLFMQHSYNYNRNYDGSTCCVVL